MHLLLFSLWVLTPPPPLPILLVLWIHIIDTHIHMYLCLNDILELIKYKYQEVDMIYSKM